MTIVSAMDRAWTDNMMAVWAVAMFLVFMSMIVSPLISGRPSPIRTLPIYSRFDWNRVENRRGLRDGLLVKVTHNSESNATVY